MQKLMEYLSDSLCIVDGKGELRYVNAKLSETLGWEIGESIEKWMSVAEKWSEWVQGGKQLIRGNKGEEYEAEVYLEQVTWEGNRGYCMLFKYQKRRINHFKWVEAWLDQIEAEVCMRDCGGKFVYCNEAYARVWGETKENIIGKYIEEVIPEPYCERYKARNEEIYQTKERTVRIEHFGKRQYELISQPILGKDGEVEVIAYRAHNVTAKSQLQEKAREVFEQFESVVKVEEKGEIKCVSQFLKQELEEILLEYTCAERLNIWIYHQEEELLSPCFNDQDDKESSKGCKGMKIGRECVEKYSIGMIETVQRIEEAFVKEEIRTSLRELGYQYAVKYPIKNGEEFLGLVSMLFKEYPGDQVIKDTSIVDMCQYIGYIIKKYMLLQNLKKEFQKRIEMEKQLQAYLDASADILVKTNKEGEYLEINEGVTKVLGWSKEEFIKQKWRDYAHPEDLEKIQGQSEMIGPKDNKAQVINRYLHKDGTYRWIQWRWKPFRGREIGYITGKDITNQKKLEHKKMKVEKLLQLDELRKEFFANISHELRTPLAVMMATHQMIAPDIEERHYNKLNQNANRLLRLVNNLIDLTKIDAGYYQIEKGNYNIIELVEELTLSLVDYASQKKIQVVFDTESEEEVIACDPYGIERVMINLLSNAIKYNNEGGKIEVGITLEPEFIVVSVVDNGVGIPEDQAPFVFERFVQVDNVMTRRCEGSGIGLSLVQSIVEIHGGEVGLRSQQGETCFWFKLPRIVEANVEPSELDELWIQHQSERFKIELSDIY